MSLAIGLKLLGGTTVVLVGSCLLFAFEPPPDPLTPGIGEKANPNTKCEHKLCDGFLMNQCNGSHNEPCTGGTYSCTYCVTSFKQTICWDSPGDTCIIPQTPKPSDGADCGMKHEEVCGIDPVTMHCACLRVSTTSVGPCRVVRCFR